MMVIRISFALPWVLPLAVWSFTRLAVRMVIKINDKTQ